MHSSDNAALQFLQNHLECEAPIFDHQNDFKLAISLIQHAEITITMRHHPIIFSMAGCVPTLSIVFDDYFKHKNIGAMKLFGQENRVHMHEDLFNGVFAKQMHDVIEQKDQIKAKIGSHLEEYRLKKGFIIRKYLKDYAPHLLNINEK
jgi:polysaccharide pyruvyl transferase WcaK-like protein